MNKACFNPGLKSQSWTSQYTSILILLRWIDSLPLNFLCKLCSIHCLLIFINTANYVVLFVYTRNLFLQQKLCSIISTWNSFYSFNKYVSENLMLPKMSQKEFHPSNHSIIKNKKGRTVFKHTCLTTLLFSPKSISLLYPY